jgi:hypothetical protein
MLNRTHDLCEFSNRRSSADGKLEPLGAFSGKCCAMLRPDARQEQREAKRYDQRIIACLLVALLLAIVFTGAAITTSLLRPAQAYPVQW